MPFFLIAAMAENRVIGKDNRLPWSLPADLARFKALTMGRTLLMGRKTYESIGRPLAGRRNVVLSRQRGFAPLGYEVVTSLAGARRLLAGEEVFVIGGESLYRAFLPEAERVFLTVVRTDFSGDARFPPLDPDEWELESREQGRKDEHNPWAHDFLVFRRRKAAGA